jgi:hypothetical protein
MTAPVADKIQLPLDTGNTGKKKRTQTRVVGADTVHTDYVIVEDPRSIVGRFKCSSGVLTVPAAVHNGTTTGFIWLYNPVSSTILMQLSRLTYKHNFTALAVDLLVGELETSRFTFTGVNSGTQRTPAKIRTSEAAAQGQMSTTWATAAATLGAELESNLYMTMDLVTGGAGHWNQQVDEWKPFDPNDELILAPGEGVVVWHAAAVTTANRRLVINAEWSEFE